MTTTTLPGTEVAAFASAVRAALTDLPPDELDELTDGLEADLAERAAETGDAELGDPAAYAEELRAAAGYPPRTARTHLGAALPDLRSLPRVARRRWDALVAGRPLIASVVSFLVSLRPVWWVFRGGAAYALLAAFLGISGFAFWPVGVAMIVLSVQLGRGRMLGRPAVRWLVRAVSALVIVAAPFMLGWALNAWSNAMYPPSYETYAPQGLTRDGMPIDNIFAYDAGGQPIDQVQLFDQDGNPLNVIGDGDAAAQWRDAQDGSMLVPSDDVPGRAGWNVYPLAHVDSWSDYADDGAIDETEISTTPFPADEVKPLSGHQPVVAGDSDPAPEVSDPATSPGDPAG